MKIRYCKQRRLSNCGPVAILNALKHYNLPVTYKKNIPKIEKSMDFENDGIWPSRFDKHVHKYLRCHRKIQPTLAQLKKHLLSGGTAIMVYRYGMGRTNNGHYAFISGVKGNLFHFKNDSGLYSVNRKRRTSSVVKKLKCRIRRYDSDRRASYPWIWFISGAKNG